MLGDPFGAFALPFQPFLLGGLRRFAGLPFRLFGGQSLLLRPLPLGLGDQPGRRILGFASPADQFGLGLRPPVLLGLVSRTAQRHQTSGRLPLRTGLDAERLLG